MFRFFFKLKQNIALQVSLQAAQQKQCTRLIYQLRTMLRLKIINIFFKKTYFCPSPKKDVQYKANGKEYMKITAFKLCFKKYDVSGQGVHVMPICEHLLKGLISNQSVRGNVQ